LGDINGFSVMSRQLLLCVVLTIENRVGKIEIVDCDTFPFNGFDILSFSHLAGFNVTMPPHGPCDCRGIRNREFEDVKLVYGNRAIGASVSPGQEAAEQPAKSSALG
jgi:hypothetical protein